MHQVVRPMKNTHKVGAVIAALAMGLAACGGGGGSGSGSSLGDEVQTFTEPCVMMGGTPMAMHDFGTTNLSVLVTVTALGLPGTGSAVVGGLPEGRCGDEETLPIGFNGSVGDALCVSPVAGSTCTFSSVIFAQR
jgi:hypothetical protein